MIGRRGGPCRGRGSRGGGGTHTGGGGGTVILGLFDKPIFLDIEIRGGGGTCQPKHDCLQKLRAMVF